MFTDQPPSSRAYMAGASALHAARGNLRDSVAGVRNLAQLLKSVRVGPKALLTILPDVHAACGGMRSGVAELLQGLAEAQVARSTLRELEEFFETGLQELEQVLLVRMAQPLSAKARLELEKAVGRIAVELDATRALFDLLLDAAVRPKVPVDLGELVRQTFSGGFGSGAPGPKSLTARLVRPPEGVEAEVNPPVLAQLALIALEMSAAVKAEETPLIRLVPRADAGHSLLISHEPCAKSEVIWITPRGLIAPTAAVLCATAALLGSNMQIDMQLGYFAIDFPLAGLTGLQASSKRAS